MDQIIIKNLEVFANHGVLSEENTLGQKFLVSLTLYLNTRNAGLEDDLTLTIDYSSICRFVHDFMKKHTFRLIETVAEQIAKELLLRTKHLSKIDVEIKKPWAPIGLPMECASVNITRQWHIAYLGLGSNLGDKEQYLELGVEQLQNKLECIVLAESCNYHTKPYGNTDQPDFANSCVKVKTLLSPKELLDFIHTVEIRANRVRETHWGPRTLDIDILYYDDLIYDDEQLCIPHPEIPLRTFVLEPLAEIAPYKHHPISRKTSKEMLDGLHIEFSS